MDEMVCSFVEETTDGGRMEVFIVRLNKTLLVIVLASASWANVNARQAGSGDISQYYGFEEIEIVKLDWGIKDLRIADFNGDGRNDIAIVNNRKARIELLIQKETTGLGETDVAVDPDDMDVNAITPPTRFARESIAVSQKLYSLVTGDMNSDSLTDLVFYGEPKGLYVILQNATEARSDKPKSLSWMTRKKIPIDDGLLTSNVLVCADLNGDLADDLALGGRDGVYIVLQPVHVRFGLKTGQLGPQVQFFIERPFAIKLEDIDGIVGDEMLTVDNLSGRLIGYKFAAQKRMDVDWPILFYPLASGPEDAKRDLALGDFDGDGLVDVTITDPGPAELILYKQTAGIGLAEPVRFPAFADITSISAADIDDDGRTELGVLSVKEKVIGLSKFADDRLSFPRPLGLTGEPVAMELADIDGDGKTDCLYISKDGNNTRTLRTIYDLAAVETKASGSGVNEAASAAPGLQLKKLTSNPDGLKVFDADQDGLQDVLIFVAYESPILVRQIEKNRFEVVDSVKSQSSLIKEASLRSIALADVDGKAGQELLVAQKSFARSLVFSEGRNWSVIDQYNARRSTENEISAVAAFDIDGDDPTGRPAILLLDGRKGQLQILRAGSDKTYRLDKQVDVGKWNTAAHLKMLFAPLTGGQAKSLMLFDSEKFAILTPPGGGNVTEHLAQQFSYETKIKDATYGNLTVGDMNSDGQPDIVMVDYKRNHVEILALDAGKPLAAMRFKVFEQKSYRGAKTRSKVSVEPRELEVADVTGDGRNDLVTVIHDRIIIYPQD